MRALRTAARIATDDPVYLPLFARLERELAEHRERDALRKRAVILAGGAAHDRRGSGQK